MKLKINSYFRNVSQQAMDIEQAALIQAGRTQREGRLEQLSEETENNAGMIGRLLHILHERGVLNDNEILEILSDFTQVNDSSIKE